ncbi:cytochrome P450 [Choanephora cucurbitarum]|nr:cytochrome P450 [Choanephora cucurbitarum]
MDYQAVYDTIQKQIEKYILNPTGLEPPAAKRLAIQLGVSTTVVYYFFKFIVYRLYLHPVNRLPGPRVSWIPFMGNIVEILREEAGAPHKRWTKQYGPIYYYHTEWNQPRIAVADDELLKQVLVSQEFDFVKTPETSRFLRRILGNGLLLSEGDEHRRQRRMLNPAFSVNSVRALVPLMAKPGHLLRDIWLKQIKEEQGNKVRSENGEELTEIEVSSGLSLAALDVIGWAFGQDFKSVEFSGTPQQSKLSQAYLNIFAPNLGFIRILSLLFPILRYLPTKRNRLMAKHLKWLNEESRNLVQAGVDRAAKEKAEGIKSDKPKDLLAIMVNLIDEETGKGFTVEELKEQCLTFLAAGHETTGVGLSWCLWLLAKNQAVQDELREEVRTLFKDDDHVPSYDEINALPLLNNVVRETLRLIPPVPGTLRQTRVPTVIGSYAIPEGVPVFLPLIVLHHSKSIWGEDAEEFVPSRWNDPEKIGNTYQYLPFLAGGRMCIGYKFALIEFKLLLAILIRDIQYFEKPGFKIIKKQQLTLRPAPNMTLWMKAI